MTEQDLNPCNNPAYIKDVNIDGPPPYCRDTPEQTSQKDVEGRDLSWLLEKTQKKTGIGQAALCDPMLKGYVRNDQGAMGGGTPDRNTVYRYSRAVRGCDEAVQDLFRDIVADDEYGTAHAVPIMWGTQEKAVAVLLQENFRNDETLVVDRIRLPMLAVHNTTIQFAPKRYVYHKAIDYLRDLRPDRAPGFTVKERYERDTVFGVARGIPLDISYKLYLWTLNREDINEIAEQIIQKITPMGYIRVQGVSYEIGVRLDSISNNIEMNTQDGKGAVYKYEFDMTAETYLPQPIVRKKAVLKTRVELVDNLDDEGITQVITRLENAVKELQ